MRKLITTDCHVAVPYAVLDELPASYREHFPRVEQRDDGEYLRMPDGPSMMGIPTGDREIKLEGDAEARSALGGCPGSHPSFEPAEVMADLEADGVHGAVLIGRIASTATDAAVPLEVDVAYCRVVNDWMAEHWAPYLDRAAPGIVLPYRDPVASAKELERCAAMGMRPALLPDGIFESPYHRAEWEPVWEVANALKVPITMHVGSTRRPATAPRDVFPGLGFVGWYNQCTGMGESLGWLTFSGVFERYPDLHVIMTEGYAGWLGFAISFWDHHWSDSRYRDIGETVAMFKAWDAKLEAPPGYYLRRQAHATFMWDPAAIALREITGTDCLLWGNDYPHLEGSYPFSQEWVDKQFAGVPESEVEAMTSGNAARIFGIDISGA
jgi:predicted TIM-barrel fold metal-dependent hydrolase